MQGIVIFLAAFISEVSYKLEVVSAISMLQYCLLDFNFIL